MSTVANRRLYLEAANVLAKTSTPTEVHIGAAILTLQAVINDLAGSNFVLAVMEREASGKLKIAGEKA